MSKLNLGKGDGNDKNKLGPVPENPEDAMNVAVSSLLSMATSLRVISETLTDQQAILYDIKRYQEERGKHEGWLDSEIIDRIENEGMENDSP